MPLTPAGPIYSIIGLCIRLSLHSIPRFSRRHSRVSMTSIMALTFHSFNGMYVTPFILHYVAIDETVFADVFSLTPDRVVVAEARPCFTEAYFYSFVKIRRPGIWIGKGRDRGGKWYTS